MKSTLKESPLFEQKLLVGGKKLFYSSSSSSSSSDLNLDQSICLYSFWEVVRDAGGGLAGKSVKE